MKNISQFITESLNPFGFCKIYDELEVLMQDYVRSKLLEFRSRMRLFKELDDLIKRGMVVIKNDIRHYPKSTRDYLEYLKMDLEKLDKLFKEFQKTTFDAITLSDMRYLVRYDMRKDLDNAILDATE